MAMRDRQYRRRAMEKDKSLLRGGDPRTVEKRGVEEYGLPGASLLLANQALFRQQAEAEDEAYRRGVRGLREKLAGFGMLFDPDTAEVTRGYAHDFDEVKAYDLHHMSYDFTYDFRIASVNVDNFVKMANRRHEAWQKAQDYLERTGQADVLRQVVNPEDIRVMKELADEYRATGPVYKTKYDDAAQLRRNTATARLDHEAYDGLTQQNMIRSLRAIMEGLSEDMDRLPDVSE